jgi:hypothetical protein
MLVRVTVAVSTVLGVSRAGAADTTAFPAARLLLLTLQ